MQTVLISHTCTVHIQKFLCYVKVLTFQGDVILPRPMRVNGTRVHVQKVQCPHYEVSTGLTRCGHVRVINLRRVLQETCLNECDSRPVWLRDSLKGFELWLVDHLNIILFFDCTIWYHYALLCGITMDVVYGWEEVLSSNEIFVMQMQDAPYFLPWSCNYCMLVHV